MAKVKMNNDSRNLYLARALYDAVEDCNIRQVSFLLSQSKADPNILISEEGMTAFHLAAGHENISFGKVAVSLILHNGGDPNVRCDGNRTVLHIAVAWNRSFVVEVLLKSSQIIPNPYLKDDDNLNAFNYAVKFNAWESLAILQSFVKHINSLRDSLNQFDQTTHLKSIKNEEKIVDESANNESAIDTFEELRTSSGYLNSGESLNSTSKSLKDNLARQKNDFSKELFSTTNPISDDLNKNILPDQNCTGLLNNISSHIYFDGSLLSSIKDDFEDLENISFPSQNLLTDSEIFKFNDAEPTTESTSISSIDNSCSMNSEWMSDISGLSSCLESDDYYTCPDTNSQQKVYNKKIDKNDKIFDDISFTSLTSLFDSLCKSIPNVSKEKNNSEASDNVDETESSDESSILTEVTDNYDTDYVRQSLRKYGHPPGPLVASTKQLYVRKLNRILKEQTKLENNDVKVLNVSKTKLENDDVKDMNVLNTKLENDDVKDMNVLNTKLENDDVTNMNVSKTKIENDGAKFLNNLKTKLKYDDVKFLNNLKAKFKHDDTNVSNGDLYSSQLIKVLTDDGYNTWKKTLEIWSSFEKDVIFPISGSSFTYLLLDPRITRNLPARANQFQNPIEIWRTFISSIFYVGKGTKSRPYDHMNEAFNSWVGESSKELSRKTEYILDIWRQNMGVVCVQAFHHLVLKEAHIREAAMIDAIGLKKLTNEKRGTYYNNTLRWRSSDRCKLGCYLLNRALHVFLADGERQLKPIDLT